MITHLHQHFCLFNYWVKAIIETLINNLVRHVQVSQGNGHVRGAVLHAPILGTLCVYNLVR